jgi:hypothetical protein
VPAKTHKWAFLLMFSRIIKGGTCLLQKTLALCSFQIPEETSKARDAMALRFRVAPTVNELHQSLMGRPCQRFGLKLGMPIHSLIRVQRHKQKRKCTKRWLVGSKLSLLVKRTKPTIIPTPRLQMVRHPNLILEGKPSKMWH